MILSHHNVPEEAQEDYDSPLTHAIVKNHISLHISFHVLNKLTEPK
jgi:hypothetical protein